MLTKEQTPHLVFQPQTYEGMRRGINLLANVIKPTLGPLPRHVATERMERGKPPELLDNGALIARRMIDLADPDANMGLMLLRQMLWQQYELHGDGTATAALLFQSIFNDGVKYITAGGNAMRVRAFLLEGLRHLLSHLEQQKVRLEGRSQISKVAFAHSQDRATAEIMSEVFDTLGEYGRVDLRSGKSRDLEREYLHGVYWESGVHSPELIIDKVANKTELGRCAVFLSDLEFDDPRTLLPIITAAAHTSALVIVATKVSERAIGLLTHVNKTPQRFQALAVKIPTDRMRRIQMLEDIARMTGARMFVQAASEDAQHIQPQDLGVAERVWANADYFCIEEDADGGQRRIQYLTELHHRLQNRVLADEQRTALRERIGQLQGASAILQVGGVTRSDIDRRKGELKGLVANLRGCLAHGVMPGGGVAFLNCQSVLNERVHSSDIDERAAYRMLFHALELPIRQILENAGAEPGEIIGQLASLPGGYGFDVATGQICSMMQAGILDSAAVVTSTLERAVRTAALALTVDVLVHRRKPEYGANP